MDSAIQASPSPASSSAFRSPCLTSASQNCKFPFPPVAHECQSELVKFWLHPNSRASDSHWSEIALFSVMGKNGFTRSGHRMASGERSSSTKR